VPAQEEAVDENEEFKKFVQAHKNTKKKEIVDVPLDEMFGKPEILTKT